MKKLLIGAAVAAALVAAIAAVKGGFNELS